jgi:hypothetical protein
MNSQDMKMMGAEPVKDGAMAMLSLLRRRWPAKAGAKAEADRAIAAA